MNSIDANSSSKGQGFLSTKENDEVKDLTNEVCSLRKTVVEQQKQIDAIKAYKEKKRPPQVSRKLYEER